MGRKLFSFPIILSTLLVLAFWLLRAECISSERRDIECLSLAAGPLESFRSLVQEILYRLSVESYLTYAVSFGIVSLGLIALCSLYSGQFSLWSFLYITAVVVSTLGEWLAFRGQALQVRDLQLAACFIGLIAFILLSRRRDGSLEKGWIEPGARMAKPTVYEVIGVFAIFFLIVCTRFYALNRLPAVWDHEACPHRAIAASWRLIVEQELGHHGQSSSGLSWVAIHHLFSRVTDPLFFI